MDIGETGRAVSVSAAPSSFVADLHGQEGDLARLEGHGGRGGRGGREAAPDAEGTRHEARGREDAAKTRSGRREGRTTARSRTAGTTGNQDGQSWAGATGREEGARLHMSVSLPSLRGKSPANHSAPPPKRISTFSGGRCTVADEQQPQPHQHRHVTSIIGHADLSISNSILNGKSCVPPN
jgi:hypothetical protein